MIHIFISKVIVNIISFFSFFFNVKLLVLRERLLESLTLEKVRKTYSSINGYYTSKKFKHECMTYFFLWAYHSLVQYCF